MPLRSLDLSLFRSQDRHQVDRAARDWAIRVVKGRSGVIRVGYFGSYARGNWGVRSDLDLGTIVESSSEPFEYRSLSWDLSRLPVPAQLLVYTASEWQLLLAERGRFARTLERETAWVYEIADKLDEKSA